MHSEWPFSLSLIGKVLNTPVIHYVTRFSFQRLSDYSTSIRSLRLAAVFDGDIIHRRPYSIPECNSLRIAPVPFLRKSPGSYFCIFFVIFFVFSFLLLTSLFFFLISSLLSSFPLFSLLFFLLYCTLFSLISFSSLLLLFSLFSFVSSSLLLSRSFLYEKHVALHSNVYLPCKPFLHPLVHCVVQYYMYFCLVSISLD